MNLIERIRRSNTPRWKLVVGGILIVLAVLIGVKLVGKAVRVAFWGSPYGQSGGSISMPGIPGIAMPTPNMSGTISYFGGNKMMPAYEADYRDEAVATSRVAGGMMGVSMPYYGGYAVGGDAENFESTQYYGRYETSRLDSVCGTIQGLKAKSYVVFLNSSKDEYRCNYSFKVENARVNEVRATLEALDPRLFTTNTETIQPILDQYATEQEILENKLESIESMLADAERTYDEIRAVAARANDIETLGKIITSHLALIERLTAERLSVKATLDQISKAKGMQTDRLVYTHFQIDVEKKEVFDYRTISDSWFEALEKFVRNLNMFAQGISIGLVSLVLYLIPLLLYVLVALVVVKYTWRFARKFWKQ